MPYHTNLSYEKWDLIRNERPKTYEIGDWCFQLISATKRTTHTFKQTSFISALRAAVGMCGPRSYESVYLLADPSQAEPAPGG